jgi:hypothetical protein
VNWLKQMRQLSPRRAFKDSRNAVYTPLALRYGKLAMPLQTKDLFGELGS